MNDREMLELAAKAAGYTYFHDGYDNHMQYPCIEVDGFPVKWEPLTDDGDALRLAAKLRIQICFSDPDDEEYAWCMIPQTNSEVDDACYRRAIVRAAAEIGRAME